MHHLHEWSRSPASHSTAVSALSWPLMECKRWTSGMLAVLAVYSLSIHADYRCRHSGACCTADWDVPVELPVYRSLNERITQGTLRVAPNAEPLDPFIVEPELPGDAAAMLERTDRGECVFFDRPTHLCVV